MIRILSLLSFFSFISVASFGQEIIKSENLKKHVYFLASDELEGRGLGTEAGKKAASYIVDHFKEIGLKPLGGDFLHPFTTRVGQTVATGNNVVGIVEGSDPVFKHEYVVIGAHYDHIAYSYVNGEKVVFNGADDNASGTSGIIEIGRALVNAKDKPKRSVILIAFDGEESGLIGSGKFVAQNPEIIKNVKLMMSIDMIGRYAESNSLIMGAMGSLKGGEKILDQVADKYKVKIKRTGTQISFRTDSKPFGDAGIPALHVTSGIIGPYHKPEDDRETLDYEGMEILSRMLYDLTIEIANTQDLEPINALAQVVENKGLPFFRYGVKANVGGSYHHYQNDFFRGKGKFSTELGLMTQFKISRNFAIQPEILYSTLGSKYTTGNFRTHSISAPVSLVIASNMDPSSGQRFYGTIGGYYSYHFAGRVNKSKMEFGDLYSQTENGLVYGIGLEVMSVFLSVNFKHSFTNLTLQEGLTDIKNRAWYITMGYAF